MSFDVPPALQSQDENFKAAVIFRQLKDRLTEGETALTQRGVIQYSDRAGIINRHT